MVRSMRPFWRYFGGKWAAAHTYPAPRRTLIVEPFAGAAGYATRFGAGRDVLLIDANPIIAEVWRWLIAATPDDVLAVGDIPDGGTAHDLDAPQAARWLAGFWLQEAAAEPGITPSVWASRGGMRGWSAPVRQRIAEQVPLIRNWRVIGGTYHDAPDVDATWFVDPPYSTPAGARYPTQPGLRDVRRGPALDAGFADLAVWCRARHGQVIVCEQVGATWLPFRPHAVRHVALGAHKPARTSHEAVWIRGEDSTLFAPAPD
jgi:hypothetical protein